MGCVQITTGHCFTLLWDVEPGEMAWALILSTASAPVTALSNKVIYLWPRSFTSFPHIYETVVGSLLIHTIHGSWNLPAVCEIVVLTVYCSPFPELSQCHSVPCLEVYISFISKGLKTVECVKTWGNTASHRQPSFFTGKKRNIFLLPFWETKKQHGRKIQ